MGNRKQKLVTEIEKNLFKHMQVVKEKTVDFTHLYIRRNNVDVDRDSLAKVLEIFRLAIDSEHLNNLDGYLANLDKTLSEFANDEDE